VAFVAFAGLSPAQISLGIVSTWLASCTPVCATLTTG
jgi:hypothetical protein